MTENRSTSTGARRLHRAALLAVSAAAVGAAALSASTGVAVAAPAAPAGPAAAGVSLHAVSAAEQQSTTAYWTPARLASAKSADLVTTKAPVAASAAVRPSGTPGTVGGSFATGSAPDGSTPEGTASPAAYPFPYSTSPVAPSKYATWPFVLNGKIFFTNNGGNYQCSGTSVASYHGTTLENEVWTAGHCVSNTSLSSPGVFDSFAEFIPAYNGTVSNYAPLGVFVASRYSVATNFLNNGDISVDEGAMEVGTNASGQTLGQAAGYSGFAWNFSSTQSFTAFGYPAEAPYKGLKLYKDTSSTGATVTWSGGSGQPLIGIGNPMTGGSSGGAWNIQWTPKNPGYINGHNDYKFFSQPNAMYSPYQDTLSNTVRCFGASSC